MNQHAMMTLSGRTVTEAAGVPTLHDIAVGLSRMPRFAGQTNETWTVAHHSLVVAGLAGLDELRLHALMHDAHEAMTSDIPTAFKTHDVSLLQRKLDARLYAAFGLPMPKPMQQLAVKELDERALLAEAYVVTPSWTYWRIVEEMEHEALDADVLEVERWRACRGEHAALDRFESLAAILVAQFGRLEVAA